MIINLQDSARKFLLDESDQWLANGWHLVKIDTVSLRKSKNQKEYIDFLCRCENGKAIGRFFLTPNALSFLASFATKCFECQASSLEEFDPEELKGEEFWAYVQMNDYGWSQFTDWSHKAEHHANSN